MSLISKVKVTYIVSNINKALAFEWIADYLDSEKFELTFILLNPSTSELEQYLIKRNIKVYEVKYCGKKDILKAFLNTFKLLRTISPQVVHTHLFDASLIGLSAAKIIGIKKRIHTRHHSTYHHVYHPQAVKYDKLINFLSTDIIAISKVVEDILIQKESVDAAKVHLIHHGFKLDAFKNISSTEISILLTNYKIKKDCLVVGAVSRYLELKGLQYIIPAFKKLLTKYPSAILVLANARGNYQDTIKALLQDVPQENYREIKFENNLFALYQTFNIFIHVPINKSCEAFGQTYVEALASGIPSIFTLSGVANEFVKDKYNALVVEYENSEAIYNAINILAEDQNLKNTLIENGKKDVEQFHINAMINNL